MVTTSKSEALRSLINQKKNIKIQFYRYLTLMVQCMYGPYLAVMVEFIRKVVRLGVAASKDLKIVLENYYLRTEVNSKEIAFLLRIES